MKSFYDSLPEAFADMIYEFKVSDLNNELNILEKEEQFKEWIQE